MGSFERIANLSGASSVLFNGKSSYSLKGGETDKSTDKWKEVEVGSLAFTPNSFSVGVSAYNEVSEAYIDGKRSYVNTQGDKLFSLGKLTYTNKEFNNGVESGFTNDELEVLGLLQISVNAPMEAKLNNSSANGANFRFGIDTRSNAPETIRFPKEHHRQQLVTVVDGGNRGAPIYFDFVGARVVGSNDPLQYDFDVQEGQSREFELFGRLYTVSEPIFTDSVKVEALTSAEMEERGYAPAKKTFGQRAYVLAEFNPNYNLTIEQAAELAGYDHFNWYQKITSDTDKRNKELYGDKNPPLPFTDPAWIEGEDEFPYYYSEDSSVKGSYSSPEFNINGNFNFRDRPTVARQGDTVRPGNVAFSTHLVGVSKSDPSVPETQEEVTQSSLSESLFNFEWSSGFGVPGVDNVGSQPLWGDHVTIGNREYTITAAKPPETGFYASDVIPFNGGYRLKETRSTSPTPIPTPVPTPAPQPIPIPQPTPRPIIGTEGNDELTGGNGDDTILGLGGSDKLIGGGGNDKLNGGYGNDTLKGGSGRNSFVFNTGYRFKRAIGIDKILDFGAFDKIVLGKTTFTELKAQPFSFESVNSLQQAQTSNALITYIRSTGALYYNKNGKDAGFGTGGQFADLVDGQRLSRADFAVQA